MSHSLVASLAAGVVRYTCFPPPYYFPKDLLLHDSLAETQKRAKRIRVNSYDSRNKSSRHNVAA